MELVSGPASPAVICVLCFSAGNASERRNRQTSAAGRTSALGAAEWKVHCVGERLQKFESCISVNGKIPYCARQTEKLQIIQKKLNQLNKNALMLHFSLS